MQTLGIRAAPQLARAGVQRETGANAQGEQPQRPV